MVNMTYGAMPTRFQFDEHYFITVCEIGDLPDSTPFRFERDPRIGTRALTRDELWNELLRAHSEYEVGDETAGSWLSSVFSCLDIEWI